MSKKAKIYIIITIFLGCLFMAIGVYYWYELYQTEQGLKQGMLPYILLKIYEVAGKWGVAGFYFLFSAFCFWKAYSVKRANSYGHYSDNEEDK